MNRHTVKSNNDDQWISDDQFGSPSQSPVADLLFRQEREDIPGSRSHSSSPLNTGGLGSVGLDNKESKSSTKDHRFFHFPLEIDRVVDYLLRLLLILVAVVVVVFVLVAARLYRESSQVDLVNDDGSFNFFDLFSLHKQIQEVELALSLEEMNVGLKSQIPITVSSPCRHCNGHGVRVRSCPVCGGSGVLRSPHGLSYCSHCGGHGVVTGEVCEVCHGQGTVAEEHRIDVHIPAGVPNRWKSMYTLDDGTQIRLCVAQKKHPRFERVGDDLIQHVHLSLKEALLGKDIQVIDLYNKTHVIHLATGAIQPFGEIRNKNLGMRKMKKLSFGGVMDTILQRAGDLVIITDIDFPDKLTEEQNTVIRTLF